MNARIIISTKMDHEIIIRISIISIIYQINLGKIKRGLEFLGISRGILAQRLNLLNSYSFNQLTN